MSTCDGFYGYDQVLVAEEYISKIAFITPCEAHAYVLMQFGLKNAGETFQRVMDHAFKDLIGNLMADCQDDLTVHSKLRERHFKHLRQAFE
jgi:uncharacterized protein (DUF2249 family)